MCWASGTSCKTPILERHMTSSRHWADHKGFLKYMRRKSVSYFIQFPKGWSEGCHTCIRWSMLCVSITWRLLYNFSLKFPFLIYLYILSLKSSLKRHAKFMRCAIYILHFVANHFQMALYPYLALFLSHTGPSIPSSLNSATVLIPLMDWNMGKFIFHYRIPVWSPCQLLIATILFRTTPIIPSRTEQIPAVVNRYIIVFLCLSRRCWKSSTFKQVKTTFFQNLILPTSSHHFYVWPM
jgi:hypothetical protein